MGWRHPHTRPDDLAHGVEAQLQGSGERKREREREEIEREREREKERDKERETKSERQRERETGSSVTSYRYGGLALEGPGLKTSTGNLKASILT